MGKKLKYEDVKSYIEKKGRILLEKDYINCDTKMKIRCSCGNIFEQTFYRFKNRGFIRCKDCYHKLLSYQNALSEDEIRERLKKSNYTLVKRELLGRDSMLTIKCNNGHIYQTRLNKFTAGRRCPICKQSQGEYRIQKWLDNNNIKYEREYTFEELRGLGNCKLRFDFCIFDNLHNIKMLIEYDGKQHFEKTPYMTDNERVRIHDSIKNRYCAENGYSLLRISYKDFTHIEEILNQQNIV